MAALGEKFNLVDLASRTDPDGMIADVAEILTESNEMMQDIPWVEGNLQEGGHKYTRRTGKPTVGWRAFNSGVAKSKSKTVPYTDTTGMMEAYSEVDKDLIELGGNPMKARLSEDVSFLEAMGDEFAQTIIYGDENVAEKEFTGLDVRYDNLPTAATTRTEQAYYVMDGGGTGTDNTSIYLIGWSPKTVFGIYPKGSTAGLKMRDLGEDTLEDENGDPYQGYRTHYQWKCGIAVKNFRYVVRICNVDVSDLTSDASAGAKLIELMVKAIHKIPSKAGVNLRFYGNDTITTFLDLQTLYQSNMNVSYGTDKHGQQVMEFRKMPVRMQNAILNTEATVT